MRQGLTALIAGLVAVGLTLGLPATANAKKNDVWQPSTWTGPAAGPPVPAAGLPPAAVPAYPVAGYPPVYDVSPTYEGQAQCDPVAKPGVQAMANLIKATYGQEQTVWIPRACDVGGTSEHKEGRALDWMTSVRDAQGRANAEGFLAWLLGPDQAGVPYGNAMRLGVMYIGWNDRIWRGYDIERGWTELKGCFATPGEGMDTTCHRNHIHISFTWDGASGRSSFWDGTPMDGPYCDRQKSGATQVGGGRAANVVPVDPVHVLGTRKAVGVPVRCRLQQDRWAGDSHRLYVKVTGVGGVPPTGVAAVAVQVTAMASNAPTNLRIWSPGQTKSQVVVKEPMNMDAVGTAIVPVASDGTIALATSAGATDVAVDVTGYYPAGDQPNDTQATPGASMPMGDDAPPAAPTNPQGGTTPPPAQQHEQAAEFTAIGSELGYESDGQGPLQPGEERVVGLNGVPDSATSALVLITTRQATKRGKLRIGVPAQKDAAALFQFPKKGVRSAVMVVPLSGKQVKFVAPKKASLQLRVEVLGYTVAGAPIKIRGVPAVPAAGGKIDAGATKIIQVSGVGTLPKKAKKITAVVLQVQTKGKDLANGTLKAYALDGAAPETRSAPIIAKKRYTTLLVAQVGTDGKVVLAPSVKSKVRATIVGYIHR